MVLVVMLIDFERLWGFGDRQTYKRTFVIVELLLRLKIAQEETFVHTRGKSCILPFSKRGHSFMEWGWMIIFFEISLFWHSRRVVRNQNHHKCVGNSYLRGEEGELGGILSIISRNTYNSLYLYRGLLYSRIHEPLQENYCHLIF